MRTLTRYILRQLTVIFLLALVGLTGTMILGGVVQEAVKQNLPLSQVTRLIPYLLPMMLRVTLPVTLLLATTTVYGRISGHNEMVAVKSMGISPMVFLWPTLFISILLSLMTVWLNDLAVSWGRIGMQKVVIEAVEEIAYGMLRTQPRSYSSSSFSINVKRVEGRRLIRPVVTLTKRGNTPTITITAEEAELRFDRQSNLLKILLRNGTIDVDGKGVVRFPDVHEQEIPLRDPSQAGQSNQNPSTLPLRQIPQEILNQQAMIERIEQKMAVTASYQMLSGDFQLLADKSWEQRRLKFRQAKQRWHRLQTESHRRWSAGFTCFCFVWVGAPMALRLKQSAPLTSFFVCFLPILIVYFPLMMVTVDSAKSGTFPPFCVWTGNVLMLIWGMVLLRRVLRY